MKGLVSNYVYYIMWTFVDISCICKQLASFCVLCFEQIETYWGLNPTTGNSLTEPLQEQKVSKKIHSS